MTLVWPAAEYLDSYTAALKRGWTPSNERGKAAAAEEHALREILRDAAAQGMSYVDITTDPDNVGSQRVIEKNGGKLFARFNKPSQFGSRSCLRYRVALASD